MKYLEINQIVYGEPIDPRMLDALIKLELLDTQRSTQNGILIAESDCEEFRAMLRLMVELEINAPGVATIIHMRRRMQKMQRELRRLKSTR